MDAFAMHPYPEKSSDAAVDRRGAPAVDDDRALPTTPPSSVKTLKEAFNGTAQPGATCPIVYDEFGVPDEDPAS